MPITRDAGRDAGARARTVRSSVSLLTGISRRRASPWPGRPPKLGAGDYPPKPIGCTESESEPLFHADQQIEVITGAARRRRWTTEEKLRIVDETLRSGESISVLARRHGVAPNLLYRWRRLMTEGGAVAVQADDAVTGNAELRRLDERMRELERQLGRKTLEVEILKEALARSRAKKPTLLATSPLRDDFR